MTALWNLSEHYRRSISNVRPYRSLPGTVEVQRSGVLQAVHDPTATHFEGVGMNDMLRCTSQHQFAPVSGSVDVHSTLMGFNMVRSQPESPSRIVLS